MDDHPRGYAGADLESARRFALVLSVAMLGAALPMHVMTPPTAAPLAVAIPILAVMGAGMVGWVAWLARRPETVGFNRLLRVAAFGVLAIATLQWLGGGRDTAYHELLVLPLVGTAMVHPPVRCALFFALVCAAMAAPELYDPAATRLDEIVAQLGVWAALTVIFVGVMSGVRRQRVGLKDDARRDSLTGLQNRRAFDEALEAAAVASSRTGDALVLAVLDLDDFKGINDRFGHPEGDACLITVARVLDGGVRGVDATFRWGGDEFAALLRGADAAEAADVCARLVADLADAHSLPDGTHLRATCGIAAFTPGMTPAALVAAADADLLAGKAVVGVT